MGDSELCGVIFLTSKSSTTLEDVHYSVMGLYKTAFMGVLPAFRSVMILLIF